MDAVSVEAKAAAAEQTSWGQPYAPSWVNRLIWTIDRLPGPTWAWYVGATVVGIVMSNTQMWITGAVPVGELTISYRFYGVLNVALVAAMAWLDQVAHAAVTSFQPAVPDAANGSRRLPTSSPSFPRDPSGSSRSPCS